jgi:dienelactone hydrolase
MKGEGKVPILFGSLPLPVPPNRSAYLARPDIAGEFATVVIAADTAGITPSIKAFARLLARHGYAVFVPALRTEFDLAVSDLADAVVSARIPGTAWASGDRVAIVGLGSGGVTAAVVAGDEGVSVLGLIGSTLDSDLLEACTGPVIVLQGETDEATPADEVRALHQELGRGEWVLYGGVGAGFFDDASPTHNPAAAADAAERIIGFLDTAFGAVPAR